MSTEPTVVLPLCYNAPISYFSLLVKHQNVLLEINEHYRKQTWRNRCRIYSPNGAMTLSVPVEHTGQRKQMDQVKISYEENWQKIHWRSLEAAYRSSPFFEYYENDFAPFYQEKFTFLADYNQKLTKKICDLLNVSIHWQSTTEYRKQYSEAVDYRDYFSKKDPLAENKFTFPRYPQVFEDRHGFIANLSILDLLFNEGPQAGEYLPLRQAQGAPSTSSGSTFDKLR